MSDHERPPHVVKLMLWLREAETQAGYVARQKRLLRALDEVPIRKLVDLNEEQAQQVYAKVTSC